MAYTPEELHAHMERLEEKVEHLNESEKETDMNDIAGLLALMQSNKGMDLPGLMALCKEKGYHNSFGGEGSFLFIFLLFFLFAGGGWGNIPSGHKTSGRRPEKDKGKRRSRNDLRLYGSSGASHIHRYEG